MNSHFDGQQEGERVLFEIHPHTLVKQFATARVIFTAVIFLVIIVVIAAQSNMPAPIYVTGVIVVIALLAAGLWWNKKFFSDTRTFITDRRIMRFERVSPFMIAKRALFWNEALKAKAYEPNLLLQNLKIGTLVVEPQVSGEENVVVPQVHYAEDLANYIDKILFIFKNTPGDIATIRPFVPKPRGARG